ncbi:hypothetical protein PENTCL1PPCAC_27650 [Pristionchus entomophagus]|uniref:Uncharacterized protein n=1 Tax=Pristionchus entomophagus TaxID=358040 RepID=A0AAV5UES2_9BILA|nr:hypothetical protein PENTCL1PPCAC_27650 [Pristionchus entomophagus]
MASSCTTALLVLLVAAAAMMAAPRPEHPLLQQQPQPRPRFMNPHARVSRFDPDQIMLDVGKMTKGFNEMHRMPSFNDKEQKIYDQTFQVMDDMASKFDYSSLYDDE